MWRNNPCTASSLCVCWWSWLVAMAFSVYFWGGERMLRFKQERKKKKHSSASGEMIDMGAFLVMYKNVPLIAAHSCSGACWKIPSPPRAPGPPSPGNVSPPPTPTLNLVAQWPTTNLAHFATWPSPPPSPGTHTHSGMHWNSIRCLITS